MQEEMMVRRCATCKRLLNFKPDGTQEGVLCCDEYYHEGDCLNKSFEGTGETWETHYSDDGDCYYTEWEPTDMGNIPITDLSTRRMYE